jgi:hypothetical protein
MSLSPIANSGQDFTADSLVRKWDSKIYGHLSLGMANFAIHNRLDKCIGRPLLTGTHFECLEELSRDSHLNRWLDVYLSRADDWKQHISDILLAK